MKNDAQWGARIAAEHPARCGQTTAGTSEAHQRLPYARDCPYAQSAAGSLHGQGRDPAACVSGWTALGATARRPEPLCGPRRSLHRRRVRQASRVHRGAGVTLPSDDSASLSGVWRGIAYSGAKPAVAPRRWHHSSGPHCPAARAFLPPSLSCRRPEAVSTQSGRSGRALAYSKPGRYSVRSNGCTGFHPGLGWTLSAGHLEPREAPFWRLRLC
jgi:hypothetical protein